MGKITEKAFAEESEGEGGAGGTGAGGGGATTGAGEGGGGAGMGGGDGAEGAGVAGGTGGIFGAGGGEGGAGGGGGGLFCTDEIVFVLSEITILSLSPRPLTDNGVNTGGGAGGGVTFGSGEGATGGGAGGGLSCINENAFVLSEIALSPLSPWPLKGNGVNTGADVADGGVLVATGSTECGFVSNLISGTIGAGEKYGGAGIACGAEAAIVSTF
jgi:hypothetical protein